MDFSSPLALRLLLLFPIAFVGILLAGYSQTRRGILFGVTVSLDFARSHRARAALRTYRLQILAVVLADLFVSAILVWTPTRLLSPRLLVALFAVPSELLAAWALWHHHASRVEPHAAIIADQQSADLVPPSTTPALIATFFSLTPLALTGLFLQQHFSQLPLTWPIHWSLAGDPDAWATRTLPDTFGPLIVGAVIVLLFLGISLYLARPAAPDFLHRRGTLAPLASLSWLIAILFSFTGLLPVTHAAPDRLMLILFIYLAIALGLTLWLLQRSGLLLRSRTHSRDTSIYGRWRGRSLAHSNHSTAGLVIPKRSGLGWTLNFAGPTSWVYLGAIFLVCIALIVLIK